jgi:ABC-type dipeptide/oligopeptide/nickel transport system permease component
MRTRASHAFISSSLAPRAVHQDYQSAEEIQTVLNQTRLDHLQTVATDAERTLTPEQIRQLRADLGLDQPFFVQFWHFLVNAAQGEFGLSLRQGQKVSRLLGERFPATFELSIVAAALALLRSGAAAS